MKWIAAISLVLLIVAGCEQPSPVDVLEEDNVLVGEPLDPVQESLNLGSIDSSGVLPGDRASVSGYFLISDVRIDRGQGVRRFSISDVLIEDRTQPVVLNGTTIGYVGLPLPLLRLNGNFMLPIPHVLKHRQTTDTVHAGVRYVQNLDSTYRPGALYAWSFVNQIGGTVQLPIMSPSNLNVLSPVGGRSHSRTEDLLLQWEGAGELMIVLGRPGGQGSDIRPFLRFKPRVNRGIGIVRRNILRVLPAGMYSLTFVLSNHYRATSPTNDQVRVLVQGAAIHTVQIRLQ